MTAAPISSGEVTISYGLSLGRLDQQLKQAEQRALTSAKKIEQALARPAGGGTSQTSSTQAVTRAQQAQAASAQRLSQLNERLQQSQVRLTLAQNTGAGRIRVLAQDYERLQARTREAGLATEELTRRQIAATNAATRLRQAQNAQETGANRTTGTVTALTRSMGVLGLTFGTAQMLRWGVDAGKAANQLERTDAVTRSLAGTTERYNQVLRLAREQQELFGGSLNTNLEGLRGLIPLSKTAGVALDTLSFATRQLAASSPEQGIQGAAFALREFLSSDNAEALISLADRFELPKRALKEIKDANVDAQSQVEALTELLNKQGFTAETLASQTNTTAQEYINLASTWSNAKDAAGSLLSQAFAPLATSLTGLINLFMNARKGIEQMYEAGNRSLGYSKEDAQARTRQAMALLEWLGLLPAATSGTDELADATQQYSSATNAATAEVQRLTQAQQELVAGEAAVAATSEQITRLQLAIRKAEVGLRPFEDAVDASGAAVERQRKSIASAEAALAPYRAAVDAAGRAVEAQREAISAAERALRPWQQAVENANAAVAAQERALARAEKGLQGYRDAVTVAQDAVEDQQGQIDAAERALRPYEDAVQASERAVRDQADALREAERALQPYREAVSAAEDALEAQRKRIQDAERALRPFEDALRHAETAERDQERALRSAEKALAPWRDAVAAAAGRVKDQDRAIREAERALAPYTEAVEASRAAVEAQRDVVETYKQRLDQLTGSLEDARRRQTEWANAPLQGSRAFSDALFDIDQQTAALQLRLLDLRIGKKDTKPSPLEEELGRVNEQVQAAALRLAGLRATGATDAAIKGAEEAYQEIRRQQDKLSTDLARQEPVDDPEIAALQEQIAALGDEAERTRLQEKLELDPLRWQLDQLGQSAEELTFEQIVAGFQATQAEIDKLTPQVGEAQAAWEREQAALDAVTAAHKRSEEALAAQQAAIEPLRIALQGYQDELEGATLALEAQDRALDPLRANLDLLKESTQAARDELARQQETIRPLRDELERLEGNLDAARSALEDADRALEPMRQHLTELQDAAEQANRALEDQRDSIQPLRDELLGLQDSLDGAQQALEDADRALDPMRRHLDNLRDGARDATLALQDQEKKIQPLRDRLVDLQRAYDNANKALKTQDETINPLRAKLGLLEQSHLAARDALDRQREKIDPLRRKLEDLGITHDEQKLKVDNLKKAIEDLKNQIKTNTTDIAEENAKLKKNVDDTYGKDNKTGMWGRVEAAIKGISDTLWRWWGRTDDQGIRGDMTKINQAMQGTWDRFWGTVPGTGLQGHFNLINSNMRTTFQDWWGRDNKTGIRGDMENANAGMSASFWNWWGRDEKSGIRGGALEAWAGLDGKGGIKGTMLSNWEAIQTKIDESKEAVKNSILAPFKGAGTAISGIMLGFGNTIVGGLNTVLRKMGDFSTGIAKSVNWVSGFIIGKDILPIDFTAPQIPEIPVPGLATGTNYWRGGWARTGEGGAEAAILPGGDSRGNMTYLPRGTKVIPHEASRNLIERGQGPETDQTKTTEPADPWSIIPPAVLSIVNFIRSGPDALVRQGLATLGFGAQPSLGGPFADWDRTIGLNMIRLGMRQVHTVAADWLRSVLPKLLADSVISGLQGATDPAWGFIRGSVPAPGAPLEEPSDLPQVPGTYPTGIGLPAALAAIIQGGYLTQGFSSRHPGIDIGAGGWAALGKPIRALMGGHVLASGYNPALEGQYMIIDAAGRQSYYGHMVQGSQRYQAGATVGRGSVIGGMGSTGLSTAPHVHFELRQNGRSVSPLDVFSGALQFKHGGVIGERVWGVGQSGRSYVFGEDGQRELVLGGDTLARLAAALERDDPRSGAAPGDRVMPIVVEEHRTYIEPHYTTYQSERDLRHDLWLRDQLGG